MRTHSTRGNWVQTGRLDEVVGVPLDRVHLDDVGIAGLVGSAEGSGLRLPGANSGRALDTESRLTRDKANAAISLIPKPAQAPSHDKGARAEAGERSHGGLDGVSVSGLCRGGFCRGRACVQQFGHLLSGVVGRPADTE